MANSAYEIECYKFNKMQVFTDNKVDSQKEAQKEGNAQVPLEWSCNIGEHPS
jgi:hypothetical protein